MDGTSEFEWIHLLNVHNSPLSSLCHGHSSAARMGDGDVGLLCFRPRGQFDWHYGASLKTQSVWGDDPTLSRQPLKGLSEIPQSLVEALRCCWSTLSPSSEHTEPFNALIAPLETWNVGWPQVQRAYETKHDQRKLMYNIHIHKAMIPRLIIL